MVVRSHEQKVLVLDSGVVRTSLTSGHREKAEFMFVRCEEGGSSILEESLIRHVVSEYGFILKDTLQIDIGFETHPSTLVIESTSTRVIRIDFATSAMFPLKQFGSTGNSSGTNYLHELRTTHSFFEQPHSGEDARYVPFPHAHDSELTTGPSQWSQGLPNSLPAPLQSFRRRSG
jgi:hypothetical protein